jgi:hypothetical protein
MELLLIVIERNGQLVNRSEILQRIWGKEVFLDTESAVSTASRVKRLNATPAKRVFHSVFVGTAPMYVKGNAIEATNPTLANIPILNVP